MEMLPQGLAYMYKNVMTVYTVLTTGSRILSCLLFMSVLGCSSNFVNITEMSSTCIQVRGLSSYKPMFYQPFPNFSSENDSIKSRACSICR